MGLEDILKKVNADSLRELKKKIKELGRDDDVFFCDECGEEKDVTEIGGHRGSSKKAFGSAARIRFICNDCAENEDT
jgi:hypothetical protein